MSAKKFVLKRSRASDPKFENLVNSHEKKVKVAQSCPTLWTCWLYTPWNSPGQNTGVGSLSLLRGSFPTQGLNPDLPHCRWILYQLSHKGSPRILEWVAYPFSSSSSWSRNRTGVSCIAGGFFTNWVIREALIPNSHKSVFLVYPKWSFTCSDLMVQYSDNSIGISYHNWSLSNLGLGAQDMQWNIRGQTLLTRGSTTSDCV